MNPLDSFPSEKLTTPIEAALAARIQKGDENAVSELAVAAMHEAVTYTRHVCGAKIQDDELISICYDVLYRGARRFNPKYKVRFVAFCKAGLRGYVRRSWKSKDVVKGVNHDKIVSSGGNSDTSEGPMGHSHISGNGALWDDEDQITPEHEIEQPDFASIAAHEKWGILESVVKENCRPREREVLELVYRDGFNFAEVAKLLGVTRSAIQSTHSGAMKKLRVALAEKKRLLLET